MIIRLYPMGVLADLPGNNKYAFGPDGKHLYETHYFFIALTTIITEKGLAAHKYYEWASRFKRSLQKWLSPAEIRRN
jgi:hypothetical protein